MWNCRKIDLGGGTILDMGVYAIQFCQWVYQQQPQSIAATGVVKDGVDLEMSAEICYGENKVGKIKSSALSALDRIGRIVGTKGEITVIIQILKIYSQFFSIIHSFF